MADGRDRKNAQTSNRSGSASGLGTLLSQFPAAAPYAAVPVGAYIAAKGTKEALSGKKSDPLTRTQTAATTFGFSEVARALGAGKGKTEAEDKRRSALSEAGVNIHQGDAGWEERYNAQTNKNFADDYVGADDKGNRVNNKFARTRDEKFLTGADIDRYAAWGELFGNKWLGASQDVRNKIGDEAVKRGIVREHHGTFDINADDDFRGFASGLLDNPTTAVSQKQSRTVSGISPRKQDPKRKSIATPERTTPKLSDILPQMSQAPVMPEVDNTTTASEVGSRNKYRDEILKQLLGR